VIYHNPTWFVAFPSGGSIVVDGTSYSQYVLNPGTTYVKVYSLSGNIFIGTNANVIIWVAGPSSFASQDKVTIAAQGGSLTIYADGLFSTSANASINNLSQYAKNFTLFGLTNCTAISLGGGSNVTGTIYAPQAALSAGNGLANYSFIGCVVAKSVTLGGHFDFHADESSYRGIPLIFTAPQDKTALVGQDVAFSASVIAGRPLGYQWEGNNGDISSATNSSLSLTNVQLTDAGPYRLVITNFFGSVTSTPALLQVYASAAGILETPTLSGSNQFQFTVSGVPGFNYTIQASTNLLDWTPLLTNQSPFIFTETSVEDFPQRFYRSVYVP
jgi:hypothetical protein